MQLAAEFIGWFGAGILVLAYFVVSARGKPPGPDFHIMNGLGAIALIINGAVHDAWPSVGLNIIWLLVAAGALAAYIRAVRNSGQAFFGREELGSNE